MCWTDSARWLNKHIFLGYWLPVLAYAILIFVFSSMPRPPEAPGAEAIPLYSSFAHMLVFAGFSAVLFFALDSSTDGTLKNLAPLFALLLTFAYGLTDEIHQHYVRGRTMDIVDASVDLLGAALAQLMIFIEKRCSPHK